MPGDPDLLLRLAQCRLDDIGVRLLHAAAREADLAGVVCQIVGTTGHQDRQVTATLHDRYQDTGRAQVGA